MAFFLRCFPDQVVSFFMMFLKASLWLYSKNVWLIILSAPLEGLRGQLLQFFAAEQSLEAV